jgi:hypothetical protein
MLIQILDNFNFRSLNAKMDTPTVHKALYLRSFTQKKYFISKSQLMLFEESPGLGALDDLLNLAIGALGKFTDIYQFAEPAYRLMKGRQAQMQSKYPYALKCFKKGRDAAIKLNLNFGLGILLLDIGRYADIGSDRREKNLKKALKIFEDMKSPYLCKVTREELELVSVGDVEKNYKERLTSNVQRTLIIPRKMKSKNESML